MDLCANADVNIDSPLDVRAKVAAQLKADLDACADILADATVALKADVKADILGANKGCDARCIEETTVSHTKSFCGAMDKVVKKLGEGKQNPGYHTQRKDIIANDLISTYN